MSNLKPAIVLEGLPVSQFDSSFPFHFIINKELEIVSEGKCLKKILSNYNSPKFLTQIFKVELNSISKEINFEKLSDNINNSILLNFIDFKDAKLKGQFVSSSDPSDQILIFIGTLSVKNKTSLELLGLSLSDIPSYEPIHELLELSEQHSNEFEEMSKCASFPNQNPNPILRVDLNGEIIFRNKKAEDLNEIDIDGQVFEIQEYLFKIVGGRNHKTNFEIEASSNGIYYSFIICPIPNEGYYNIYGSDITDKKKSELKAQENFDRLNNFLESTDDAYYIVYKKNKHKNYFTSRWPLFFGFDPKFGNIWKQKSACVIEEHKKMYDDAFSEFQVSGNINLKYKIKNQISGQTRWILEEAKIKIDASQQDEIISGRITDITTSENFRSLVNESEERFRLITESMPVMIWVSNEENKVIYTNQSSNDFYGFDLKELKGQNEFADVVHPDYRKSAIEDWRDQLFAKEKCEMQYLVKNRFGQYRWVFEIAVPRFTNQNTFLGYIGCTFDITTERDTFYKLEEEKKKFEMISNKSADIIFLIDKTGNIEYVSSSIKRILGREENSVKGKSFYNLIDDNSTLRSIDFNVKEDNSNNNRVLSFRMKHNTGDSKWVEAVYSNFSDEESGGDKILIHVRDINEQHVAQSMLIENEARYRRLFSNMNLGIVEVDSEENILYVNRSFERISGYDEDDLIGKNASEIFIKDKESQNANQQESRNRALGKEGLYEIKVTKKDGTTAIWVISGAPTFDMKGKVRGSIGIHWDVTEIRALENKILIDSVKKEKELMEAKLQAEEVQRELIGRDLHDGVGQMLAYLSLYLNVLKEKKAINNADVEKAQTTLKSTIDEVRRLSRNLAPPAIKDLGFREAVIELINSYGIIPKPRFQLKIYKGIDPDKLLHEHKLMLFRILQELSSNTFKHAKAENVEIEISFSEAGLEMHYKDDGIGFDSSYSKKGVGLKSIFSRLEFYNGKIQMNTNPGKGLEVMINLPYQ
jgi:PAS domain S-box-containing protein